MDKYLIIFALSTLFSFNLNAQDLSPDAEISLLTCSPGTEVYALFGHSALRVKDATNDLDRVYNYGTFDFDTPNFYGKFLKGQLLYRLAISPYYKFERTYRRENRAVYEQVLDLTATEKQQVYAYLKNNYLPKNREYPYDFFLDNCSTRIRDVFDDILGNDLNYGYQPDGKLLTFRELLAPYLQNDAWSNFGLNLILGLPTDDRATTAQYMFLPYHLMAALDNSTVNNAGRSKKLVKERATLIPNAVVAPSKISQLLSPNNLFWLLFVIVLLWTVKQFFSKQFGTNWLDVLLFFVVGIVGAILLAMWLATEHLATYKNLNLLWALPTHLLMAFALIPKKKAAIVRYYYLLAAILLLVCLLFWNMLPQQLPTAALPLILTLLLRSLFVFWRK